MNRGLEPDVRLAEIARRNLGLVTDAAALEAGLSRKHLRDRLEAGTLVRVLPRVMRLSSAPVTWEQRQLAACRWAGHGWVSSGLAAAALWELEGVPRRRFEISGAGRIARRPPGIVVHERCVFVAGDLTTTSRLPVTSPARTLIDLAPVLEPRRLERAVESALRRGLVTPLHLSRRMRRLRSRGRKGVGRLVAVLVRRGDAPASDSDFEVRLLQVLRDGGLPPPVRQRDFFDDDGFVARVDFVYPIARLILEADSYKHHGPLDWQDDADKRARLIALGYRILSITWRMVNERPEDVCSLVARSLRTTTP